MEYYIDESNYIEITATINFINHTDDKTMMYLGFENLSKDVSDNCFKIVGDNYKVLLGNGFNEKIQLGDEVSFYTAPKYFGDGYVMPIVALSKNGEALLEFDEGYENFLEWLKT